MVIGIGGGSGSGSGSSTSSSNKSRSTRTCGKVDKQCNSAPVIGDGQTQKVDQGNATFNLSIARLKAPPGLDLRTSSRILAFPQWRLQAFRKSRLPAAASLPIHARCLHGDPNLYGDIYTAARVQTSNYAYTRIGVCIYMASRAQMQKRETACCFCCCPCCCCCC